MKWNQVSKRNAEGYMDETAYMAMKNTIGGAMENINTGDIWKRQGKDGQEYPVYILRSWKDVSVVLSLVTLQPYDGDASLKIRAQEMMWADARKVSYCNNKQLTNYVRQASDTEMNEIEAKVAEMLFGENAVIHGEEDINVEDSKAYQELLKDVESMKEERQSAEETAQELAGEIEKLTMELEEYKLRDVKKEKPAADKKAVGELEKTIKKLKKENEILKKEYFELFSKKVEEMAK